MAGGRSSQYDKFNKHGEDGGFGEEDYGRGPTVAPPPDPIGVIVDPISEDGTPPASTLIPYSSPSGWRVTLRWEDGGGRPSAAQLILPANTGPVRIAQILSEQFNLRDRSGAVSWSDDGGYTYYQASSGGYIEVTVLTFIDFN